MTPVADPRYSKARWSSARDFELAEGQRIARWEYYKPLLMIIGGLGIVALVALLGTIDNPSRSVADALAIVAGTAIGIAISTVIAVPAIVIACKIMDFDSGPILLMPLRLAGIYSVLAVVGFVFGAAGLLGLAAYIIVMGGLVAWLFDVDFQEGLVVTFVAIVINVAITWWLLQ